VEVIELRQQDYKITRACRLVDLWSRSLKKEEYESDRRTNKNLEEAV
jgi:hypothetical protein